MQVLLKTLLLGLIVCVLALGSAGCRKRGNDGDGTPGGDDLEIEAVYDIEIGEGEWEVPEAVNAKAAGIYQTVYYDLSKSHIREESRVVLEAIADDLNENRRRYLRAVGHCCDLDTNEYNFALGERRAASVKAYLVALGVDAGRIRTLSKGEEEPAVPNDGKEGNRRQNRRVEFRIVDK